MRVPFVGRGDELNKLKDYLRKVIKEKKLKLILLEGENGVGKTEVINQFKIKTLEKYPKALFAIGNCIPNGGPYHPFLLIFNSLPPDLKKKGKLIKIIKDVAPDWLKIIPGFVGNLVSAINKTRQLFEGKSILEKSISDQEIFLQGYSQIMRKIVAKYKPLILCIEDAQWIDSFSTSLLFHLIKNLCNEPILIICTYRPYEIERGHPLVEILSEIEGSEFCHKIFLNGLKKPDILKYLWIKFPNNKFGEDFVNFLESKTNGNPSFLDLLIDHLLKERIIVQKNGYWQSVLKKEIDIPLNLLKIIDKRIKHLKDDIKRVLKYASVEGEKFTSVILSKLLEWDELTLLEQLEMLEKIHRLIKKLTVSQRIGEQYRFVNSLIHKRFYDSLNQRQKQLLHRKIGEILEILYKDKINEIAESLAIHFEMGGDFKKALTYRIMCATIANSLFYPREATKHCKKGLALLNRKQCLTQEDIGKKIDLLIELGKAKELENDFERALKIFGKCEELAKEVNDQERMSDIYFGHGRIFYRMGEYERAIDALTKSLNIKKSLGDKLGISNLLEAIGVTYIYMHNKLLEAMVNLRISLMIKDEIKDNNVSKARLLQKIGTVYYKLGRYEEALTNLGESLKIAESFNDIYLQGLCLSSIAGIYLVQEKWKDAIRYYKRSLGCFRKIGDKFNEISVLTAIGHCYLEGKSNRTIALKYASKYYENALQQAEKIKSLNEIAWANTNIGKLQIRRGNFTRAKYHLDKALKIYQKIEDELGISFVLAHMGEIHLARKEFDLAAKFLEKALKIQMEKGTRDMAKTMFLISKLHFAKKEYDVSLIYANLVGKIMGFEPLYILPLKSKIYYAKGNRRKAKEYCKMAQEKYQKLCL